MAGCLTLFLIIQYLLYLQMFPVPTFRNDPTAACWWHTTFFRYGIVHAVDESLISSFMMLVDVWSVGGFYGLYVLSGIFKFLYSIVTFH